MEPDVAFLFGWAVAFDAACFEDRLDVFDEVDFLVFGWRGCYLGWFFGLIVFVVIGVFHAEESEDGSFEVVAIGEVAAPVSDEAD